MMTDKQMEKLYDLLAQYREDEIQRSGDFKDKYCGTKIEYYIEDYKIQCSFSRYSEGWQLCISVHIKNSYGQPIYGYSRYESSDLYNVIINKLDKMFETVQKMGPVFNIFQEKFNSLFNK